MAWDKHVAMMSNYDFKCAIHCQHEYLVPINYIIILFIAGCSVYLTSADGARVLCCSQMKLRSPFISCRCQVTPIT